MSALHEKLAASLEALRSVSEPTGRRVFKSSEFSRLDRELLTTQGYLRDVSKGWLMLSRPGERDSDSTSWNASFQEFCGAYLEDRFGSDWRLSAETSLRVHAGNLAPRNQVIVHAPGGNNGVLKLPHGSSVFVQKSSIPGSQDRLGYGIRAMPIAEALAYAVPGVWQNARKDVVACLGMLGDHTPLLRVVLAQGKVAAAGRIAGAFRILGRPRVSDAFLSAMRAAGHDVREDADPFGVPIEIRFATARPVSPVVTRIRMMWSEMRLGVLDAFPTEPPEVSDPDAYLASIEESAVADAYHSLSIEGYQVSEELIEMVRSGRFNPDGNKGGHVHRDAMAAKGYLDASARVRNAIAEVLAGAGAGEVAERGLQAWYGALFEPQVRAGLLRPEHMAGYRDDAVFIRNSGHVPVAYASVPDAMDALFGCLKEETDARVRAVMGHYAFTYIHPYMDGNGRCGRFLMNLMLASGGYPWTIIPVDWRDDTYFPALESASGREDIRPFAAMINDLVNLEPSPPRKLKKGEELSIREGGRHAIP